MNKQFGGTMLGVVIGVVAGLVVALLVAVYVTKVPVPFLNNKNAGNIAARDASEAKKNKDWDPNGPLASKSAVRPPPPAETPSLGGANNPVALPPLTASPPLASSPPPIARPNERTPPAPTVASVDQRPRGSADPLGDLARARSTPDRSTDSGADQFAYFVQAGAFRGASEAEAQRAKLAIMGWEAQVSEREQAGRSIYRVRLGPFGRKDDADRAKEKLDDAGLQTALVRVQR